jgi:outer membrane protein OmpA-like peptidoglycan-associated protein
MTKTIPFLQLTLALGLAFGVSACQSVSDAASGVGDTVASAASALDPTTWFGGDDSAPPPPDAGSQTASSDTEARTSPDLANLPARPATSTPAQQQAAAQSLAADGAQARYSADSLRAGTEAAAAPPGAMDAPPSARLAAAAPPPPSANDQPPTTDAPPSAQPVAAPSPPPTASPPPSASPSPVLAQGTSAVPTSAVPAGARPAPVQTAALAPPSRSAAVPPPGAEPAVPADTPVRSAAMGSRVTSDAALGFRPSAAPPLDPSVSQWVSAPIVARYRQTASNAGIAPAPMAAVPPKGGAAPDMSGGAVIANLDAVSTGPAAAMSGGPAPTAVVFFPGDGTTLSPAARSQIKAAVSQYKAMGAGGAIRVVGHSSSRTANMPVEKHLELIFEKSQQRANAVAQELIHEGVPADRVLIEAVGDSQPVYYESMPKGEDGNRRAEIFVQG